MKEMLEDVTGPIHFIGIGGTGMSGLAELALRRGLSVQGSDLNASHMTNRLATLGARIHYGQKSGAVDGAQTVVYSSAISSDNIELLEAAKNGAMCLHRSDFLAWLMRGKCAITVAGTHGKSTTSAMIVHVLDALGMDPSAAIGGILRSYDSTARHGTSPWFVAESDESDGSFLKYHPYIAVVTNIDLDHMEFYKTELNLVSAFANYLKNIVEDGTCVVGWDNPLSRQVGTEYSGSRLTYGLLIGSEVRAFDIHWDGSYTRFTAIVERDQIPVRLKAMGRHNVQNALCTLAVVRALDLDVAKAAESLSNFQGVDRRMALIHDLNGIKIFDDYAHNPGKIAACIGALRSSFPKLPLHVVYQPHRYTRLETMYDAMLGSLKEANHLYLLPVYAAGETTTQDFSPERLARDMHFMHEIKPVVCQNIAEATNRVFAAVSTPAVILTVGAGDVHLVSTQLRDVYAQPK
jgi:UDP-N-acetylmuramate--alanine ligase